MDEAILAKTISEQVVWDTKFWIALIGIIGGVIGSAITVAGNVVFHWFKEKPQRDFNERRIRILKEMLEISVWTRTYRIWRWRDGDRIDSPGRQYHIKDRGP